MLRITTVLFTLLLIPGSGCSPSSAVANTPATTPTSPKATVGEQAPDFTLNDLEGNAVSLADYRGKTVVIEWFNPDCPFVKYAHGPKGPLRGLASKHADGGVIWLAINSGAPGKQGAGLDRNKKAVTGYEMNHPVLLDESGAVGRSYSAKTTPHMFVVNGEGVLVYAGALDNAPLGNGSGAYINHVDAALSNLRENKPVDTPSTKPYGCSVKYGA